MTVAYLLKRLWKLDSPARPRSQDASGPLPGLPRQPQSMAPRHSAQIHCCCKQLLLIQEYNV